LGGVQHQKLTRLPSWKSVSSPLGGISHVFSHPRENLEKVIWSILENAICKFIFLAEKLFLLLNSGRSAILPCKLEELANIAFDLG
jgi:hypothetical protein